jgi:hypothetical protein
MDSVTSTERSLYIYHNVRRHKNPLVLPILVGGDSLVDIATRYGLDGPEIESR